MIIIIVATILVFFLLFSIVFYPWTLMFFGFLFQPNPPKPEFTYGEFSCLLKYELNGETKIIEDTIICEFDGFKNLGTAGKKTQMEDQTKKR